MRFIRGETSIRLDIADRLADYFGLETGCEESNAQRANDEHGI